MNILIVAGYFAPYCPASASRVNKLAKYMEDKGHDVRVLCPKNEQFDPVLQPEVSRERIFYTAYSGINDFPTTVKDTVKSLFSRIFARTQPQENAEERPPDIEMSSPKKGGGKESVLSHLYRKLTNVPDSLVGWYLPAIRAGQKMFRDWSPDIIFATMPPFTTMLVAHRLGRMIDVPVVYDYRDLWTDHPYYDTKGLRKFIDVQIENHVLKHAAGLVTVTKTWADHLKTTRSLPVEFVMNGFDPGDFSRTPLKSYQDDKITLLYAGYLYGDKRDPTVVFEALAKLGAKAQNFNVLLYTPNGRDDLSDSQNATITKYGLEQVVQCHRYIPQKELLEIQQRVDSLMLLRWDDPSENGVIAGKLFEYIGAGKPILCLGSTTGEAADIIRENDFGLVSDDSDEVAEYLKTLLDQKDTPKSPNPNREKFTRARQFEKLVTFMEKVIVATRNNARR